MHCRERHSKPGWFLYIPDSAKLTEADIDAFVRCLVPVVRMAVFSKAGTGEAALTLHNLALVRPEMVLPDLLNRYVVLFSLSLYCHCKYLLAYSWKETTVDQENFTVKIVSWLRPTMKN